MVGAQIVIRAGQGLGLDEGAVLAAVAAGLAGEEAPAGGGVAGAVGRAVRGMLELDAAFFEYHQVRRGGAQGAGGRRDLGV